MSIEGILAITSLVVQLLIAAGAWLLAYQRLSDGQKHIKQELERQSPILEELDSSITGMRVTMARMDVTVAGHTSAIERLEAARRRS